MEFNPARHQLGAMCKRGHDWNETGQSARYIKSGSCLVCMTSKPADSVESASEFYCPRCRRIVPAEGWYKTRKGSGKPAVHCCKSCWKEYTKENYDPAKERVYHERKKPNRPAQTRRRGQRMKRETIAAYGGACACCGEATYEFLSVDHVHGGGSRHRLELKQQGVTGWSYHRWLKAQGYPPEYRILCNNCNWARGQYGYCPHTQSPPLILSLKGLSGSERTKVYNRNNRRILKTEILEAYGRQCACCGVNLFEFLTIDHIHGGGTKHARECLRNHGAPLYQVLKNTGFPDDLGLRILCMNCNMSYGAFKYCPHDHVEVKIKSVPVDVS